VVNFSPGPNTVQTAATVALERLTPGQQATISVPMVGAPPAPLLCPAAAASGQAVCSQLLNGTILPGGAVKVTVSGQVVAQGAIATGGQPPNSGVAAAPTGVGGVASAAPTVGGAALAGVPPPLPPGSPLQPAAPPTSLGLLIPGA